MVRFSGGFALAIVLSVVCAAAVDESGFLVEMSDTNISKVKTANYYGYGQTELSCLSQLNFKSCRYTGCPECLYNDCRGPEVGTTCTDGSESEDLDLGLTNIFFQTDFTCCPKDHPYGYGDKHEIGSVGFSDKVGTCDWEISIYRWPNPGGLELGPGTGLTTDITPVLTDDGNAVKFGTAWGTCYLNAEAEHCDHPLCERMAINVQGGLYVARAYGDSDVETVPVLEETCNGGPANVATWLDIDGIIEDIIEGIPLPERVGSGAGAKAANGAKANNGANKREGGGFAVFEPFLRLIRSIGLNALGITSPAQEQKDAKSQKGAKKAAVEATTSNGNEKSLYPGAALIISGPFTVTSKHTGKIAETGLFEFAPLFFPDGSAAISEPTQKWPVVRAKGAKMRFTKEEKTYDDSYGDNKYDNQHEDYSKREYYRER